MKKRLASDADAAPEVVVAKGRRGGAASASVASCACGTSQPAWMAAILKVEAEAEAHAKGRGRGKGSRDFLNAI